MKESRIRKIDLESILDVAIDPEWERVEDYVSKGITLYKKRSNALFYVYYDLHAFQIESEETLKSVLDNPQILSRYTENESALVNEILFKLNPFGRDFPKHTSQLIETLCTRLAIPFSGVNEDLVKKIDEKLNSSDLESSFIDGMLLHFIALEGEWLRKKHPECVWEVSLSSFDAETWNPILMSNGRQLHLVTYTSKYLLQRYPSPIQSLASFGEIILFGDDSDHE